MPVFQVAWKATTRNILIQPDGAALPSGYADIGSFTDAQIKPTGTGADNLVLFHHVRDLLYAEGELNMQTVTITCNPLTAIAVTPATASIAVAATQQLTVTPTPADASNVAVTYATSDATKATVSASGLVTGVAAGSATITITSDDGGYTDTVAITVTA